MPSSASSTTDSSHTARPIQRGLQLTNSDSSGGIPVTPAVLRSIFASSRTPHEERSISRIAFFRFTGFLLSCLAISLAAARGRGIKSSAALLGVV
ncbi:hypothetical protein Agabi119p4_4310 [Agaricus bisporus var. burnettii]|uniref:Uncharacterized protein n=1 Tax=Agaricus bisporus var. burnettii TaxID=192524 RepID=A0A8H7F361_AGABI|nr:hypothetical protein Agabi119p4_4310 [Agaricus bisporus var. burnettii]